MFRNQESHPVKVEQHVLVALNNRVEEIKQALSLIESVYPSPVSPIKSLDSRNEQTKLIPSDYGVSRLVRLDQIRQEIQDADAA